MKKLFFIALAGLMFFACEKKSEPYGFKSDGYIYLNGVEHPKFKSTDTQYSIDDILHGEHLYLCMLMDWNCTIHATRGFAPEQRDTANKRLLMYCTDILTAEGELVYDFINAVDVHIRIGENQDTCAYIPQSVIDSARVQIEALYAQERYDEIYELFHTAFVFYPCTGEEYKQIMAGGGN